MPLLLVVSLCLGCVTAADEIPHSTEVEQPPPMLFLGGLGASRLQADLDKTSASHWYCENKATDYGLWLFYMNFVPLRVNCWMDNMRLKWHNGTLVDKGVKVKLIGDQASPGEDISASFAKDLWSDLLRSVADLGYSATSSSVAGLHFDWRLGPAEFARDGTYAKFKKKIEGIVARTTGKKAVLVTLSYGSVLMHKFLSTEVDAAWKSKYVERWISFSGVFGGTAELTRVAFYPNAEDFYNLPEYLPYVTLEAARDMSNTFSAPFVQRPTFANDSEVILRVGTSPKMVSYTKRDIAGALGDAGLVAAKAVYEGQVGSYVFDELAAPGVRVDCIYGVGDDTINSVTFGAGFNQPATAYGREDGDGVAPTRSLARCAEWGHAGNAVSTYPLPHVGHGGTLHSANAVAIFSRILRSLPLRVPTSPVESILRTSPSTTSSASNATLYI